MHLRRRNFLSSIGLGAGALFLRPLGRELIAEAQAMPAPKRLVIFADAFGWCSQTDTQYKRWLPRSNDLLAQPLPAGLAPLEPYKRQLTIADEFYNPFVSSTHNAGFTTLSMVAPPAGSDESGRPGGATLDRYVARRIGQGTPVVSLNVNSGVNSAPTLSADGMGQVFPIEPSPVAVYTSLFGAAMTGGATEAAMRLEQDRSVLDLVRDDITRLNASLAGPERAKLDQYLTSLRAVEQQLTGLAATSATCTPPAAPASALLSPNTLRTTMDQVATPHVELVAAALKCGLTRVAVLRLTRHHGTPTQAAGDGKHHFSHINATAELNRIDAWHAGKIAALWERLRAVPEGNGTMADNTLILWVNSGGGKHHQGYTTNPVVMLGTMNGYFRGGRRVPYAARSRSMADVYLTALHALGIQDERFGDARHNRGPLAELRA